MKYDFNIFTNWFILHNYFSRKSKMKRCNILCPALYCNISMNNLPGFHNMLFIYYNYSKKKKEKLKSAFIALNIHEII